jgi:hypothetical protein
MASARSHLDQAEGAIERTDYSVKQLFKAWGANGQPYAQEIHDLAEVTKEHTTGKRRRDSENLINWTRLALTSAAGGEQPRPRTARELVQPDGKLMCPVCGSSQFETKISTGRKLMFGVASVLGSADQIQCFACGTKYERG